MARPPLELETWGTIRRTVIKGKHTAVAYYRDSDGITRPMQRQGKTKTAAERNLLAALRARLAPSSEILTPDSRISSLAELWFEEVNLSGRSSGTKFKYRENYDRHIKPALGGNRIFEAGVPRIDRFLKALAKNSGPSSAKLSRVVLAGMFGLALRHGVVKVNPMKSIIVVSAPRKKVVALKGEDVQAIWAHLTRWDKSKDKRGATRTTDLADVAAMFIATGVRTGEVFALKWPMVNLGLDVPTVTICRTVALDDTGKMYVQDHPKSDDSNRNLILPPFAVSMLVRRKVDSFSEFVFPSSTGTFRSPNNFRTQWTTALKETAYAGVTPKSFRQAVATLLDNQLGGSAAKDQLGHASQAVTDRHYIERAGVGPDATSVLEDFFKTTSK